MAYLLITRLHAKTENSLCKVTIQYNDQLLSIGEEGPVNILGNSGLGRDMVGSVFLRDTLGRF